MSRRSSAWMWPAATLIAFSTGTLAGARFARHEREATEVLAVSPDVDERFVFQRGSGATLFEVGLEKRAGDDGEWRRVGWWIECNLRDDAYFGYFHWWPVFGNYDWDGLKQGYWKSFRADGITEETYFEDGNRLGSYRAFFSDGTPAKKGWYNGDGLVGPYVEFESNGAKVCEGTYRRGKREGEWRFWSPEGRLDAKRSGLYEQDERVAPLPDEGG